MMHEFLVGETERNFQGDLGTDRNLISKWILKKYDVRL
jgi:hypothetical protein